MEAYYLFRKINLIDLFPGQIINTINTPSIIRKILPKQNFNYSVFFEHFPKGIGMHGLRHLTANLENNNSHYEECVVEIVFELVRQQFYPTMLSRLTSLYAVQTLEQAENWINIFGNTIKVDSIWKIKYTNSSYPLDAKHLDANINDFSYIDLIENAHKYWKGQLSDNPLIEILVELPVQVLHSVKIL